MCLDRHAPKLQLYWLTEECHRSWLDVKRLMPAPFKCLCVHQGRTLLVGICTKARYSTFSAQCLFVQYVCEVNGIMGIVHIVTFKYLWD